MREFTRTLAAGQQEQLSAVGDYVYVKAAVGVVRIITDDGQNLTLEQEQGIRFLKSFNGVDVVNEHDQEQKIIIIIGSGDFQNQRVSSSINNINQPPLNIVNPEGVRLKVDNRYKGEIRTKQVIVGTERVKLLDEDPKRRKVVIRINDLNVGNPTGETKSRNLYVGDNTVTVDSGFIIATRSKLGAGEVYSYLDESDPLILDEVCCELYAVATTSNEDNVLTAYILEILEAEH